MSIKAGTTDVKKIYAGSTPVKAVYAGDTKVWPVGGGANPLPDAPIHSNSMMVDSFNVYSQPPLDSGNTHELRWGNPAFAYKKKDLHLHGAFYTNALNKVHEGIWTSSQAEVSNDISNAMIGGKQYRGAYRWSLVFHMDAAGIEGPRNYYMRVPSVDSYWATNVSSWGIMIPSDELPWDGDYNVYDIGNTWTQDAYGGVNVTGGVPDSWAIWVAIAMSSKDSPTLAIKDAVYVTPRQAGPDRFNSPYDFLMGYGYVPIGADGKATLRAENFIEAAGAGGAMLLLWEKA